MPRLCYLDANPLMRIAESDGAPPEHRSLRIEANVTPLIESADIVTAISQVSILEVHTNACKYVRQTEADFQRYDDAWLDRTMSQLMEWISGGSLIVRQAPPNVMLKAIAIVERATREARRNLRSWDAVHLIYACQWAREEGRQVELVSNNGDFRAFLDTFPEFASLVNLVDPS
jgi:hypothetical protein